MATQTHPPLDAGGTHDPFHATRPTILVHDVDLMTFERAWRDADARCPQGDNGTADERGTEPIGKRRWVHFTCGDVIAVEFSAG
jgi:hypothetical protein